MVEVSSFVLLFSSSSTSQESLSAMRWLRSVAPLLGLTVAAEAWSAHQRMLIGLTRSRGPGLAAFVASQVTVNLVTRQHAVADASPLPKFTSPKTLLPKVVFVLGGPGSGKGTQSERLASEFGYTHLSAGELLRIERESGSKDGQLIEEYISEGKIVPVAMSLGLLKTAMERAEGNRFLIDGFPRNEDNLQGWEDVMGGAADVSGVLFLDCPSDVLQDRLLLRGQSSGRSDDNLASAVKRFKTFQDTTMPVVRLYEQQGSLCYVDGNQDIDAVAKDVAAALSPIIKAEVMASRKALCAAARVNDLEEYKALCDPNMTALGLGRGLLEGNDCLQACFEGDRSASEDNMTCVRLTGKTCVLAQDGCGTSVWQVIEGVWRQVHFCASREC